MGTLKVDEPTNVEGYVGKGQPSACGRGTQYEVPGLRPHVHLVAWPGPVSTRVTRCHARPSVADPGSDLFCQCRLLLVCVCVE